MSLRVFLNALLRAGWAPAAVFCYGTMVAGALGLYARYPWLDSAMHFLGGAAAAYFFFVLVRRVPGTVLLVLAVAIAWELSEHAWDLFFGTDLGRDGDDTARDLFFGMAGASVFLVGAAVVAPGAAPGGGRGEPGSAPGGTSGR